MRKFLAGALGALAMACAGQAGAATIYERTVTVEFDASDEDAGFREFPVLPGVIAYYAYSYYFFIDQPALQTPVIQDGNLVLAPGERVVLARPDYPFELLGYGGAATVPSFVATLQITPNGRYFSIPFTQTGIVPSQISDIAIQGVPEPATWGLLIAGFGMTGWSLRRRRLQQTA